MKCSKCGGWRKRLHSCVECGVKVCGCCGFRSRAGLVCSLLCQVTALAKHDALTKAMEAYKQEQLKKPFTHEDSR